MKRLNSVESSKSIAQELFLATFLRVAGQKCSLTLDGFFTRLPKTRTTRESKWIERNHRGQRGRPMTTWTKIREKDGTAVKFAPAWYEERPRTEQQSVEECYAQLGFSKDVFIACVRDRISQTFGTT